MAETGDRHGPVIGIDLGTACSCVAVWQHGRAEIVTNEHGGRVTPSYIAFTDTERLVGDAAKSQASRNPTNTVFEAARRGGGRVRAALKDKAEAEAYIGGPVKNAVVTVPASFDVLQRRATKHACAISGLDVLGVIHEPTAAGVAYGIHGIAGDKNVLVFDLGGGHTSVSLLAVASGKITVKATAGDPHLGGEDFSSRMVEHFVAQFKAEHKKDVARNARAMVRLRAACEQANKTLSSASWATIELERLHEDTDFYSTIMRDQFDDLNLDLFCKCLEPIKKCLAGAKMDRSSVDDVVLVGGSTRIPRVRRLIQDLFDGKELRKDINPEEAAARGLRLAGHVPARRHAALARRGGCRRRHGGDDTKEHPNSRHGEGEDNLHPAPSQERCCHLSFRRRGATSENTLLCELKLPGTRNKAKPGVKLSVSVCFSIDADGVLTVSARDRANGHKNQMRIVEQSQLSKMEIERMAMEAKE
uniref:Uncharacterized protein n=1 Tax=Oryza punctata TaxID=4537 RepID=A0A0E0JMM7_ORYPU